MICEFRTQILKGEEYEVLQNQPRYGPNFGISKLSHVMFTLYVAYLA